jgi:hypothetical protein
MSHLAPPWCLHWGFDGELARVDRDDLDALLLSTEHGRTQQLLNQIVVSRQANAADSPLRLRESG